MRRAIRTICSLALPLVCFPLLSAQTPQSSDAVYNSLIQQTRELLKAGSADQALTLSQTSIQVNPARWEAYDLAGEALTSLHRYEEAQDQLTQAITRAPQAEQAKLRALRQSAASLEMAVTQPTATPAPPVSNPYPQQYQPPPTQIPAPVQPYTAPAPTYPAAAQPVATQAEAAFWQSIQNSNRAQDFQDYLAGYPSGAYAQQAQAKLDQIAAQVPQMAAQSQQYQPPPQPAAQSSQYPAAPDSYAAQYPSGQVAQQTPQRLSATIDAAFQIMANVSNLSIDHPSGSCKARMRTMLSFSNGFSGDPVDAAILTYGVSLLWTRKRGNLSYETATWDLTNFNPQNIDTARQQSDSGQFYNVVYINFPGADQVTLVVTPKSPFYQGSSTLFALPDDCPQNKSDKTITKCSTGQVANFTITIPTADAPTAKQIRDKIRAALGACQTPPYR